MTERDDRLEDGSGAMALAGDLRAKLGAAVAEGEPGLPAADRLCRACVDLLDVDGAAVSIISNGVMQGTFGSSGELSRRLDEFQYTFGEGPCLDSVRQSRPVLVGDLRDAEEKRWPAYAEAVLDAGVRAVFALPVPFAHHHIGALDLFRTAPRPLGGSSLAGSFIAAELVAVPLMHLIKARVPDPDPSDERPGSGHERDPLGPLDRLEVHQATGMLMVQLDVGPAEALVRLRAHAFAHGLTAVETARLIVTRALILGGGRPDPGTGGGGPA